MLKEGIVTTAADTGCRPMEIMELSRRGLDRGWLKKRGSILDEKIRRLTPRDGQTAIYMVPISGMEVAGSNRNGDYWPSTSRKVKIVDAKDPDSEVVKIKRGLKERYPTFESHARMYREHKNDDPDKASGDIVEVAFNEPMGRVECIAFVDDDVWEDDLHRLASNDNIGVSMSARVPHDICNVCGNKASRRSDYCVHARHHMNAILSDGTQVGVINESPTFFDISGVRLNADRLGFALSKLPVCGEKAAGSKDLRRRKKVLRKLAEMEKKITTDEAKCVGRVVDPRLQPEIGDMTITIMKSYDPRMVGSVLKEKDIMLGPKQFLQLVGDSSEMEADRMVDGMKEILPGIFQTMLEDMGGRISSVIEPLESATLPCGLSAAVDRIKPDFSIAEEDVDRRLKKSIETFEEPPEITVKVVREKEASSGGAEEIAREYGRYLLSLADDDDEGRKQAAIVASNRLIR